MELGNMGRMDENVWRGDQMLGWGVTKLAMRERAIVLSGG